MRVLLVSNATKVHAIEAMQSASKWLADRGIEYQNIFSERLIIGDPMLLEWVDRVSQFDLVVCFGGDGTILRVCRMIGTSGVPLLAFNFGGLGFLASAPADNQFDALSAALTGAVTYDQRVLIEIQIDFSDGSSETHRVLNEVVVSRLDAGRVVSLDLLINGLLIEKIRGDGMLVSSASGSTAYALSAGGPLLHPSYNGMVVLPIAAHSLKSWSIVAGSDDVLQILPSSENTQQLVVFLDGELIGPKRIETGSETLTEAEIVAVTARTNSARLNLVQLGSSGFYRQLKTIFFSGADSSPAAGSTSGEVDAR